jgi:hypothetical protein
VDRINSSLRPLKLSGFMASSWAAASSVRPANAPGKIASRLRVPLQRRQHVGQATAEQFRVEKALRFLKSPVGGWRNRFVCCPFHNCIRYNRD